jgi:hypothetical protein
MRKHLLSFFCLVFVLVTTVFSVSAAPPTKPVITSPEDGEVINTHTPLLSWQASDGATSYKLILQTSQGAAVLTKTLTVETDDPCSGGDNCSYSMVNDDINLLNRAYRWRVIARNQDGNNASPFANFTVDFPGKPTLVSPANNAAAGQVQTFQWNVVDQAELYTVVVEHINSGNKTVSISLLPGEVCSGDVCSFTFNSLLKLGANRWWVEARQLTFPNVSRSAKRKINVALG